MRRRPRRATPWPAWAVSVLAAMFVLASPPLVAAGPGAATVAAWEAYVRAAEARIDLDTTPPRANMTTSASARDALAPGDVLVEEVLLSDAAIDIPDGRVHHWRGRVFVPGITLEHLVTAVRDPLHHKQEDVIDARLLERTGDTDRVYLKIRRSSLVTAAFNTEHRVTYKAIDASTIRSRSVATKIAEIEGLGTPAEREKRPDEDRGFLWRMNAYWCYAAVPGGVMVTLDSMTLSRDVPWAIAPIASPIVDRVARESVVRTLRSLRARF
ncbi:MAG: hypothetical protein LC791_06135 [Acidobacteria bacterium]|nr:hypothetical protein [Acidobacteriota bacterium]